MTKKLRFNEKGMFKIVQFTDLHMSSEENHPDDEKTLALMDRVIQAEEPDLLVYSGDVVWSEGTENPEQSFRRVLDAAMKWHIPFAIVYGNHDAEENITRQKLQNIQSEYAMAFSEEGPKKISGVGNYTLTIGSSTDEEDEAVLYFIDSGEVAPAEIGGYDWIRQDQVNWYVAESKRLQKNNDKILPALAFFHIPLPEYDDVWQYGHVVGSKGEKVSAPKINSGLFAAMIENGDVIGTFVGHDHDNDYCGHLAGISLCYGRVTGYQCYGELQRGARVINLHEGKRYFDTWIRLDDQTVLPVYTSKN